MKMSARRMRDLKNSGNGTNIWVTDSDSVSITKLRASDGTLPGTYNVGINPRGVIFDGTNVWVVNYDSNTITKL